MTLALLGRDGVQKMPQEVMLEPGWTAEVVPALAEALAGAGAGPGAEHAGRAGPTWVMMKITRLNSQTQGSTFQEAQEGAKAA